MRSFGFADDFFILVLFGIWDHWFLTGLPSGRADFSVLFDILERFDQSQILIWISSDGQVVYWWVLDDTVSVNDVSSSVGNSLFGSVFTKTSVSPWNGLVEIRDQWDFHGPETSIFPWLERVLHVRELWVNWASEDFASDFSELLGFVAEGYDFGGADKGEIKRVEEQNYVFSFVVWEVDFTKVSVEPGWGFELRSWLSDQWHIFLFDLIIKQSRII